MNRYTYKAKRKDNGEWVYGYYGKFSIGSFIITNFANSIEIIPETLCQCTGLQDKDGNYIFENDNVCIFYNDEYGNVIDNYYIIEYYEGCFWFNATDDGNDMIYCEIEAQVPISIEIIRNKFDEVKE